MRHWNRRTIRGMRKLKRIEEKCIGELNRIGENRIVGCMSTIHCYKRNTDIGTMRKNDYINTE